MQSIIYFDVSLHKGFYQLYQSTYKHKDGNACHNYASEIA